MKNLRFLLSGILFGIIAVKSEIISWYRIHEMFYLSPSTCMELLAQL